MPKKSIVGELLIANPLNPKDGLDHSVILMLADSPHLSVGLQLNRQHPDLPLSEVFIQTGLWYDGNDPLYIGGNMNTNKIHVVHSLDWSGLSTIQLGDNLGLTSDISVLAAMSRGDGPELFRACAGVWLWDDNALAQQLNPRSDSLHRWETAPATLETVFSCDELAQWHKAIEHSAATQVSAWF